MSRSTFVLALVAIAAGVGCAADTRASGETAARDAFDPRLVPPLVRKTALAGDLDAAVAAYRRAEDSNPHCCGDGQEAAGSAASKVRALTRVFADPVAAAT